jgi:hypothetical protein
MSETGISEAASENTPKRKRGRPRLFSEEEMQRLDRIHRQTRDKRTGRSLQNFAYFAHAMAVIEPLLPTQPELRWLCDPDAVMRGEARLQMTIMQELGRIYPNAQLVAFAVRICELRPKTREAVKMLRKARLEHGAKGSIDDLAEVLRRTLNNYLRWRPHLTLADAQESVGRVWKLIDDQLLTNTES